MARAPKHADFIATLVADGCLPLVQGKSPAKIAVKAREMDRAERELAGAPAGALAVAYPVDKGDVFLQMSGSTATAWYDGVNCDGAVLKLDQALRKAQPTTTLVRETPHPDNRSMTVRVYRVELGGTRFADVEATYPVGPHVRQQFVVRVHAWERS